MFLFTGHENILHLVLFDVSRSKVTQPWAAKASQDKRGAGTRRPTQRMALRVFKGKLVLCQCQGKALQSAAHQVLTGLSWVPFQHLSWMSMVVGL